MRLAKLKSESGLATLIALLMVGMLTLLGIAAISSSDDEVDIAGNEMHDLRAFYAAEAGLEQVAAALETEYKATGVPPALLPEGAIKINEYGVSYSTVDDGAPSPQVLTRGTLAGLNAIVKSFTITSTSHEEASRSSVQMTQNYEAALVPIFQFAVFYNNDLEIAPGPNMTLAGRVHTNGNLYLQSNGGLSISSYMTSAGNIIHGRKGAGGISNGDVLVKDMSDNYVSMKLGSGWLDSKDSEWLDSSMTRWQGRVEDAAHGQTELAVPLTGVGDPHRLIEPAAGNPDSYESKASLKHIDGTWYQQQSGVWQDVTAGMTAAGVVTSSPNKFHDGREKADVDVVELDIDALYKSTYVPDNGVIYFSQEQTGNADKDFPALRLINGTTLGGGLTIASENPVYTLGDYNSVGKKPAAILADAVTFLSSAWDDSKGKQSKSNRVAVATKVNASYLTGNTETTDANYNGGFENLPRFLEKWSNKKFTWQGSAVNLWNSVQANGDWTGTVYSPPIRDWSYDPDLDDPANMPPESPAVRVFQRTGWKQEHVGFSQIVEVANGGGNGK